MLEPMIEPQIDEESRSFWEGLALGEFRVDRCAGCGAHIFPRRGICRFCRGREMTEVTVEGSGVLASFTVNHQVWGPEYREPYGVALVEFPRYGGIRLAGLVTTDRLDDLQIGMAMVLRCVRARSGFWVPGFAPATEPDRLDPPDRPDPPDPRAPAAEA